MGPEKSHQDFIYGNTAVRIKIADQGLSEAPFEYHPKINWHPNDHLFLRIYRLSSMPDSVLGPFTEWLR